MMESVRSGKTEQTATEQIQFWFQYDGAIIQIAIYRTTITDQLVSWFLRRPFLPG